MATEREMAAGPWGRGRRADELSLRWASGLQRQVRMNLHEEREELIAQLDELDQQLRELQARRAELVAELRERRDQLWPRVEQCHGRRPPAVDSPPLPPMVDKPTWLWGRRLRATCLALLRREGKPMALRDLHAALHLHGYGIASEHPVRALSDALGYEVELGRAKRVSRGVYQAQPAATPQPCRRRNVTPDPFIRFGPEEWFARPDRGPRSAADRGAFTVSSHADGTVLTGDVHSPT